MIALSVVGLSDADGDELRQVRLRALKDSPDAFASDYDVEWNLPTASWQERLTEATWVIARCPTRTSTDSQVVGVARLSGEPSAAEAQEFGDDVRFIESVWVAPSARRQGVLRQMLASIEAEARQQGLLRLALWVFTHNVTARNAYERLGFVDAGDENLMLRADGEAVWERRMEKKLTAS